MSTAKIEEVMELLLGMQGDQGRIVAQHIGRLVPEARAELEAIKKAAKTLADEAIGDFVYTVRDRHGGWMHPKVTAYSEATALVDAIAKEAP